MQRILVIDNCRVTAAQKHTKWRFSLDLPLIGVYFLLETISYLQRKRTKEQQFRNEQLFEFVSLKATFSNPPKDTCSIEYLMVANKIKPIFTKDDHHN